MNDLRSFFKKTHWLILPALLALASAAFGVWLVYLPPDVDIPLIAKPFFILGLFYALFPIAGIGAMESFFMVWTMTFCFFALVYLFGLLMYRMFIPRKATQ
jgi:hypothetical protein